MSAITILSTLMTQIGIGERGFSALVEADGRRIIFDTGLRPDNVLLNAESMNKRALRVAHVVPEIFWERLGASGTWAMGPKKEAFEAAGGRCVEHDGDFGLWACGSDKHA